MQKEFNGLKEFLDSHKAVYSVHEHEKIVTAEQASAVRNVPLHQGVKSLVFEVSGDHKDFVMVLVRGDKKADSKKLASLLNAKNVRLADHKEVAERTGCEVGSVHPFGNLFGLTVYMDKTILENHEVSFSAGTHNHSMTMKTKDFVGLIKPKIEDIAK